MMTAPARREYSRTRISGRAPNPKFRARRHPARQPRVDNAHHRVDAAHIVEAAAASLEDSEVAESTRARVAKAHTLISTGRPGPAPERRAHARVTSRGCARAARFLPPLFVGRRRASAIADAWCACERSGNPTRALRALMLGVTRAPRAVGDAALASGAARAPFLEGANTRNFPRAQCSKYSDAPAKQRQCAAQIPRHDSQAQRHRAMALLWRAW